jgi:hypothetical protein
MAPSDEQWTALHEAAHAVFALHFGHKLESVTIRSSYDELAGHGARETVLVPDGKGGFDRQPGASDARVREEIVIALAGAETELALGRDESLVLALAKTDHGNIHALLSLLGCRDGKEAGTVIDPLVRETQELVRRLLPQIEAVGRALFERGTLTGDEARVVMECAA